MNITEYTHDEKGKRIDVHAPSNIDVANYELSAPLAGVPWYKSGPFFDLGSVSGICHHCGHAIRYATSMVYLPTGEKVTFGADCTDLIDLPQEIKTRAGYEFTRLKKRAANEREALKHAKERDEKFAKFVSEHADIVAELQQLDETSINFLHSMKHALDTWGNLTPGQVKATQNIMAKQAAYRAKLMEEALNPPSGPVVNGRHTVTGEVLSVKWRDDMRFGGSYKMTVKLDDTGSKVWGTVPNNLYNDHGDDLKGKKVTFTATFEQSKDDEFFGYFKRPTNASAA